MSIIGAKRNTTGHWILADKTPTLKVGGLYSISTITRLKSPQHIKFVLPTILVAKMAEAKAL